MNPNLSIPQLPVEIWYRILLFCPEPKTLSQTQKNLYGMSRNPITTAKWLYLRYDKDAYFAALWHWSKSKIWKQMIRKAALNKKLDIVNARYTKRYSKNWYHSSAKTKCKRCNGYGLMKSTVVDKVWLSSNTTAPERQKMTTELKEMLSNRPSQYHCSLERFQWETIAYLVTLGLDVYPSLLYLLRFAATTGHSLLFDYTLQLCCGIQPTEYNPTITTKLQFQTRMRESISDILRHSLKDNQLSVTYQCLQSNLLSDLTQRQWTQLFYVALYSNSISLMYLFLEYSPRATADHLLSAIRLASGPVNNDNKKMMRWIGEAVLETLPTDDLLLNEQRLVLNMCEGGHNQMLRYMHSKNANFNFMDSAPLFQSILFGHRSTSKMLLNEFGVNPNVFRQGRTILVLLVLLDHFALFYATITAFGSLINAIVCKTLGLGAPSLMVFGFRESSAWCILDPLGTMLDVNQTVLVFVFFLLVSLLINLIVPIVSFLCGLFMIIKRLLNRRIEPLLNDIENQVETASTAMLNN
ncbi:hypothetical protein BC833DRAFT_561460 [Globomyces pollinis-pini]|nr:hypothetical protein BC833DRAFT_561460 [Globomyces pollinis-pini]KAJ2999304.1 hypothetical protein HDV02_003238 [Globomyces sp. JEL0801]